MINVTIKTNLNIYKTTCQKNTPLKDLIKSLNINFIFPCGCSERCFNCKVKYINNAPNPSKLETIKLKNIELEEGIRLACCSYITEDVKIELNEIEYSNFIDI